MISEISARLYHLTKTMSLEQAIAELKEKNHPTKIWEWPQNTINFALMEGKHYYED